MKDKTEYISEAFGMPVKRDADGGFDMDRVIAPYLEDEILDLADKALKSIEFYNLASLPVICAGEIKNNSYPAFEDCTFKPFMELVKDAGGYTAVLKLYRNGAAFKDNAGRQYFISETRGVAALLSLAETKAGGSLGVNVRFKCEYMKFGPGVYAVTAAYTDRTSEAGKNLGNVRVYTSEDLRALYDLGGSMVPDVCCGKASKFGKMLGGRVIELSYDSFIPGGLKQYRDFISERVVNPEETDVILTGDYDGVKTMKVMLGELSQTPAEELTSRPHSFKYINLTGPLWEYTKIDLKFIKELGLPLAILTEWKYLDRRERIGSVFGINLTPEEYGSLKAFAESAPAYPKFCVVNPVEESFTFVDVAHPYAGGEYRWVRKNKNTAMKNNDEIIRKIDEAFMMPDKLTDTADREDRDEKSARKIIYRYFEKEVLESAEDFLLKNTPPDNLSDGNCPYGFLSFTEYGNQEQGGPRRFMKPALSLAEDGDGCILTIKSCATEALNNRYRRNEKSAYIEFGTKLMMMDDCMERLEKFLEGRFGRRFTVKMDLVDLGPGAGEIWLDDRCWMCDVDVPDYSAAEELVRNAVRLPFPCIPCRKEDPGYALNILFWNGCVTLGYFVSFLKRRAAAPNTADGFNLRVPAGMSDNNLMGYLETLRKDSAGAKGMPLKIASIDFSGSGIGGFSGHEGYDLLWVKDAFPGAGVIFCFVPGADNPKFTDRMAMLTRGLYTAETQAWLTVEAQNLRRKNRTVYSLIWYPETGELCYEVKDEGAYTYETYNVPAEVLGGAEGAVDEAFKMPGRRAAPADDGSDGTAAADKIIKPLIADEISKAVAQAVADYRRDKDKNCIAPVIKFNTQDLSGTVEEYMEYLPAVRTVGSGGGYTVTLSVVLPDSPRREIFGAKLHMLHKMFDYIMESLGHIEDSYGIGGEIRLRADFIDYQNHSMDRILSFYPDEGYMCSLPYETASEALGDLPRTKLIKTAMADKCTFVSIDYKDTDIRDGRSMYIGMLDRFIADYTDQKDIDGIVVMGPGNAEYANYAPVEDFCRNDRLDLKCPGIKYVLDTSWYNFGAEDFMSLAERISDQFGMMISGRAINKADKRLAFVKAVVSKLVPDRPKLAGRIVDALDNPAVNGANRYKNKKDTSVNLYLVVWPGAGEAEIFCKSKSADRIQKIVKVV